MPINALRDLQTAGDRWHGVPDMATTLLERTGDTGLKDGLQGIVDVMRGTRGLSSGVLLENLIDIEPVRNANRHVLAMKDAIAHFDETGSAAAADDVLRALRGSGHTVARDLREAAIFLGAQLCRRR